MKQVRLFYVLALRHFGMNSSLIPQGREDPAKIRGDFSPPCNTLILHGTIKNREHVNVLYLRYGTVILAMHSTWLSYGGLIPGSVVCAPCSVLAPLLNALLSSRRLGSPPRNLAPYAHTPTLLPLPDAFPACPFTSPFSPLFPSPSLSSLPSQPPPFRIQSSRLGFTAVSLVLRVGLSYSSSSFSTAPKPCFL